MSWSDRPVFIDVAGGTLHGTFAFPAGDQPVSAALILPGSGPVDRDGNVPGMKSDCLRQLAHGLTERGIATLRIDKRGVAESARSGMDEEDLRFSTYVDDACQWLDFLALQPRIISGSLIGHSEGALVATLAAQRSNIHRLVLIAGCGRRAGDIILAQLKAAGMPSNLLASAQRALLSLEQGQAVVDAAPELGALFRASVQPYLISWLALDPAKELAKVSVPTLVVHGTNDLQVDASEGQLLATSGLHVRQLVVDRMNHVLKLAPSEREGNLAAYDDSDMPIADGLASAVAAFLR